MEMPMTMKDNDVVSNKGTDFDLIIKKIRDLYYKAIQSRAFGSGAEKIHLDSEWTNLLQRLNGHGNSAVLNSFKLRLEMDEENEEERIRQE
jgi:hypothetical protein